MIVDRWTVTVASVGDSRCILDTQGGAVTTLTVDHRLEENIEEYVNTNYSSLRLCQLALYVLLMITSSLYIRRRQRVTASGGEVGRLSIVGGAEVSISCCIYAFRLRPVF